MSKQQYTKRINNNAINPEFPVFMSVPAAIYMDLKQSVDSHGWDMEKEILFRLSLVASRKKAEELAFDKAKKKKRNGGLNE